MKDNLNEIVIMAGDPIPDKMPTDVRNYFSERKSERDLADAFAIASNKFWWVEDNIYDYEEGTPEHIAARTIAYEWAALMDEYMERIFTILRDEGIKNPKAWGIKALKPFMKRNGYVDGGGWWIKDKGSE